LITFFFGRILVGAVDVEQGLGVCGPPISPRFRTAVPLLGSFSDLARSMSRSSRRRTSPEGSLLDVDGRLLLIELPELVMHP
jgi:hypothetical protein